MKKQKQETQETQPENKSMSLTLRVQPSLYETLKELAVSDGRKVSDYIHKLLKSAAASEKSKLSQA